MGDSLKKQAQDAIATALKALTSTFSTLAETPEEFDTAKQSLADADNGTKVLMFSVMPKQKEDQLGYYEQALITTAQGLAKVSDGTDLSDDEARATYKENARDYLDIMERALDGAMTADETFGGLAVMTEQVGNATKEVMNSDLGDLVTCETCPVYRTTIHYRPDDDENPC